MALQLRKQRETKFSFKITCSLDLRSQKSFPYVNLYLKENYHSLGLFQPRILILKMQREGQVDPRTKGRQRVEFQSAVSLIHKHLNAGKLAHRGNGQFGKLDRQGQGWNNQDDKTQVEHIRIQQQLKLIRKHWRQWQQEHRLHEIQRRNREPYREVILNKMFLCLNKLHLKAVWPYTFHTKFLCPLNFYTQINI